MKHTFFALVTVLLVFTACNNESGQATSPTLQPVNITTETTEHVTDSSYDPASIIVDTTGQTTSSSEDPAKLIIGSDPLEGAEETETPAIMVNPAHGEPGHRCDVPVGAPMTPEIGSVNYCDS